MYSFRQGIGELPYICLKLGIKHAIISPGSRNAPLIMAFAKNPKMHCLSITDERCAGFYALGMAQYLQKPVVLICTSGTAALNYAPAIAEAYYQQIPLIVLTADRPPEWIDQNDGQTIRQNHMYGSLVKKSCSLPLETLQKEDLWLMRRTVSEAINTSILGAKGPVHINIPFREPLYHPLQPTSEGFPVNEVLQGKKSLTEDQWRSLKLKWSSHKKKLIVCGMSLIQNMELSSILEDLVRKKQAVVIAENLSNLYASEFIDTAEHFIASLSEMDKKDFAPGLLITLGGSVVSKRLKKYLREYKPNEHWHVDEHNFFVDTFQTLNYNLAIEPIDFFQQINNNSAENPSYVNFAQTTLNLTKERFNEFILQAPFTDLTAYHAIVSHIPDNYALHLANSTPVRYAQLFNSKPGIQYFSNRGTSGIDGCMSTATGYAMASGKPTLLLVGDLGFIYDSNALWNNKVPANIRIIVLENDGGNIFKLIDTSDEIENIQHFFETPHQVHIGNLTNAFGVQHLQAQNLAELKTLLKDFFKPNDRPVVLSIKTSGLESANTFKKMFQFISQNP